MNEQMTEEKQITALRAEIRKLASDRVHHLSPYMVDLDKNGKLTLAAARMVVEHLGRCPSRCPAGPAPARPVTAPQEVTVAAPRPRPDFPPAIGTFIGQVPEGYYATPSRTGNNDFDFWTVDCPAAGKWAGRIFVKRVLGGGSEDEMRTEKVDNMQQRLALQAILELGTEESALLFAQHLGRCSDCGRALTDEESRAFGKGRICRAKKG